MFRGLLDTSRGSTPLGLYIRKREEKSKLVELASTCQYSADEALLHFKGHDSNLLTKSNSGQAYLSVRVTVVVFTFFKVKISILGDRPDRPSYSI